MSFDYEKVIPAPISMKRKAPKPKFNYMSSNHTHSLEAESKKISKSFREKVAQDLERMNKKNNPFNFGGC